MMQDVLLAMSVFCFFILGFWPMKRLDRFLEERRQFDEQEDQVREPSYILLTEDMTDEEVNAEISFYREKHRHAKILLYDNQEAAIK